MSLYTPNTLTQVVWCHIPLPAPLQLLIHSSIHPCIHPDECQRRHGEHRHLANTRGCAVKAIVLYSSLKVFSGLVPVLVEVVWAFGVSGFSGFVEFCVGQGRIVGDRTIDTRMLVLISSVLVFVLSVSVFGTSYPNQTKPDQIHGAPPRFTTSTATSASTSDSPLPPFNYPSAHRR